MLRHCERSEAIQGRSLGELNCFASLAMTTAAPSPVQANDI